MNAIAAHGAQRAQVQPQIVVVNDGKPVESVERTSKAIKYAKYAGIFLVPLFVGVVVGQISSSAKTYNKTIEDAGKIADDIKVVGSGLQNLKDTLLVAKERGPGGTSFKIPDEQLTTDLQELRLSPPEADVVFHSYLYEMDAVLVKDVLTFYTDTIDLYREVAEHIKLAEQEAKAISTASEELQKKNLTPTSFAVYIDVPKDDSGTATARFVELGLPLCGDGRPNPQGCPPEELRGFLYRPDSSGAWGPMELGKGSAVTAKQLLFLAPTGALLSLIQGSEFTVAYTSYQKRINDIDKRVDQLMELRKAIQSKVLQVGNRSERFTFFL